MPVLQNLLQHPSFYESVGSGLGLKTTRRQWPGEVLDCWFGSWINDQCHLEDDNLSPGLAVAPTQFLR